MDKSPKPVAAIAPFGLRMQPALKSALEDAAKNNARSLNAEIVARLEASFSGGSSEEMELLKMKMEYRDEMISMLNEQMAQARSLSKSQASIIAMLGAQIRMLIEGYPDNGDPIANSLRASLAKIADALAHNDFEAALIPMQAIVDNAVEKGYLNKDGGMGPKHPLKKQKA